MKITDLFAPFPDELQLAATPRVSSPPRVEWASAWGDLFFRIKGADPQIVWCVLGRGAPEKRPLSRARLETLGKYLSAAYAGRTFFRVVPFAESDDWALVRPKRALVKSPLQRKGAIWQWRANFAAPDGEIEWLSQPLGWFENWLRENADDELRAAREFAPLSDDERNWLPVCRTLETQKKWEQLMPALRKLSYSYFLYPQAAWYLTSIGDAIKRDSAPFTNQLNASAPALLDCFAVLWRYFPLDVQHKLWRGIGVRGKEVFHVPPRFEVTSPPTQHEKLEAALLWRNFGPEIGERERVEAALTELLASD